MFDNTDVPTGDDGQTEPVRLTNVPHLITERGVTAFINGRQHIAGKSHPNYARIVEALRNREFSELEELFDVALAYERKLKTMDPDFRVENGLVFLNDVPFPDRVSTKAIAMIRAGSGLVPLLNFLRKMRLNPAFSAQQELLDFCDANNFLIAEDGDIIAYKGINENWNDCHTNSVCNKVAHEFTQEEIAALPLVAGIVTTNIEDGVTVVSMPRHEVDDDRNTDCSHGLHFAAYDYARQNFGQGNRRMVLIKVNPRDVVAVPKAYGAQKGRCCRYEVVMELQDKAALPEKEVYSEEDYAPSAASYRNF